MDAAGEQIAPGSDVVAADGERLGRVRVAFPHFFLVEREETAHRQYSVPLHAVHRREGGTVYLTVNRDALTEVDNEEAADPRLHHREG